MRRGGAAAGGHKGTLGHRRGSRVQLCAVYGAECTFTAERGGECALMTLERGRGTMWDPRCGRGTMWDPRRGRGIPGGPPTGRPSAGDGVRPLPVEQFAREVAVAAGGEPKIAYVDPLVGAMDERGGFEQRHVALGEEAVGDALRELLAEPARVREAREDHRHGLGARIARANPAVDRVHERALHR